jgi:transcriptional regulator with XRE-family HTH domain
MPQKMKKPLPPAINNLGKRLAGIRKAQGITQTQLANTIGIDQCLISSYEIGRLTLSADMFARFCRALQCSADEVLDLPKVKFHLIECMNAELPEPGKKHIL